MTAGTVSVRLRKSLENCPPDLRFLEPSLQECRQEFDDLKDKRNTLLHGYPSLEFDGFQRLHYGGRLKRGEREEIPYTVWQVSDIAEFVRQIDAADKKLKKLTQRLAEALRQRSLLRRGQ